MEDQMQWRNSRKSFSH